MDLYSLNERQREAVTTIDGPVLVLAGAGSGKTRVLTYRIAHMVSDCAIHPYNILALTFTNKAAREMKARTEQLLGDNARDMWVSTFHATCSKILRIDGDAIEIDRSFTIYDDSERKTIISPVMERLKVNEKLFSKAYVLHVISDAKNHSVDPIAFIEKEYRNDANALISLYRAYESAMKTANALDFDDLILLTSKLFINCPEILEKYRNKFRYVLVDEYQDTNLPQYQLIRLLCEEHHNICVVGDDDQSIYGWRGADIRNILEFEKDFEGAKVIRLEQNYRSTGNILNAANAVISNNAKRKGKNLFTESGSGDKIINYYAYDEKDEANYICKTIENAVDRGVEYKDFAVLYRTNAQSRVIENALLGYGIRYKVFGGQRFYERMEIRDIMAYLRLIANPNDNAAFKRIVNIPARGIGAKSIEDIEETAYKHGMSIMSFLVNPMLFATLSNTLQKKFLPFVNLYQELCDARKEYTASELAEKTISDIGYREYLFSYDKDYETREENLSELLGTISEIEEDLTEEDDGLLIFLENAALATDMDEAEDSDNYVSVMTIHSAKGLEYNTVFLAGAEEQLFPSARSLESPEKLEEERRLCYVAITRAKKKLHIINAQSRRLYNRSEFHTPSRFLSEIPDSLLKHDGLQTSTGCSYNNGNYSASNFFSSGYNRYTDDKYSSGRLNNNFNKSTVSSNVLHINTAPSKPAKLAVPPKPKTNPDADKLAVGQRVSHSTFGSGVITNKNGTGSSAIVTVEFDSGECKKLSAGYAPLIIIE